MKQILFIKKFGNLSLFFFFGMHDKYLFDLGFKLHVILYVSENLENKIMLVL